MIFLGTPERYHKHPEGTYTQGWVPPV
jgi:hypothetical protein